MVTWTFENGQPKGITVDNKPIEKADKKVQDFLKTAKVQAKRIEFQEKKTRLPLTSMMVKLGFLKKKISSTRSTKRTEILILNSRLSSLGLAKLPELRISCFSI